MKKSEKEYKIYSKNIEEKGALKNDSKVSGLRWMCEW